MKLKLTVEFDVKLDGSGVPTDHDVRRLGDALGQAFDQMEKDRLFHFYGPTRNVSLVPGKVEITRN